MNAICSSRLECIWSLRIPGKSSCFLIWLREHALSVAIYVNFLVSAAAVPVSSALFMVLVTPTSPECTLHLALVWGQYTPVPL